MYSMSTLKSQKRSIFLSICFAICLLFASAATTHAATFTVTNTNDSGAGSLREAITNANANGQADVIDFDGSVFGTHQTIYLNEGFDILANGKITINGPAAGVTLSLANSNLEIRRLFSLFGWEPSLEIRNLTLTGGKTFQGGGIYSQGSVTVINSTITGNVATEGGGAIASGGLLTLINSTVSGNSAAFAGGIANYNSVTLINSTVSGNSGATDGGGIYNENGIMTLTNSLVSGNSAYRGGAIYNAGTGTLANSTVSGNSATDGGGIYNASGPLTLTNSTVSGNMALQNGGGIHNYSFGTLTLTNSTVSNNSGGYGGGVFNHSGVTTMTNSIIAYSPGGDCENWGTINAEHTLIRDGLGCVNGTDLNNLAGEPMLGPLQDNGGPTMTHALLPGSPAIDAGSNPLALITDQRGAKRVIGAAADIGAFEYGGTVFTVTKTADTNDGSCDVADCSLREAIEAANSAAGDDTISFEIPIPDPGYDLGSDRYTITLTSVLPNLDSDMSILGLGAKRLTVTRDASAANFGIFRVNESRSVSISGLTLSGGKVSNGGAIRNLGSLIVAASTLSNNNSLDYGGAVYNQGSLEIIESTISGNWALVAGGGIFNGNLASATTKNVTISSNSSGYGGAGVRNQGHFNAVNSTVTTNWCFRYSPLIGGGGGIHSTYFGTTLKNSIISGNVCGSGSIPSDHEGTLIVSAEFSMVGGDAHLGPLQDNGGPTMTHAPLCGSPAIDAGKNFVASVTDQRGTGFARTFDDPAAANAVDGDGTDIGSFELQEALACNTAPVANDDSYSTDEDTTLNVSAPGVLGNDSDGEDDTLIADLVVGPAHGFVTLFTDGSFSYTPNPNFNGSDSFTYKANDGPLDSNVATVTITVRAINDAPTVSLASPATQTVQYSDNVIPVNWSATDVDSTSVTATLEYSFNGGAFVPISSPDLLLARSINCNSGDCSASVYGTISIPAGVYTIRFKVRDAEFTSYSDHVLTVTKEHTETEYTGDDYALTAGPTADTANVRLAAQLIQDDDSKPGEITKAKVRFLLFKNGNTGSTPDLIVSGVPVDDLGAALTFVNLPVDIWTVKVKIDADNGYWKAKPVGMGTIMIEQPTNELRTSGGGWVAYSESVNNKGNFGFNVANQKKGVRGNSVYLFRGLDGFNYLVKSTSWNNGGIGFNKEGGLISLASFSGKCVVQKIDPETGEVVESFGNYSFTVDVRDGDLFDPRQPDKYAITILDGSGHVWRQVGAPNSPLDIGGGNVTVKGK